LTKFGSNEKEPRSICTKLRNVKRHRTTNLARLFHNGSSDLCLAFLLSNDEFQTVYRGQAAYGVFESNYRLPPPRKSRKCVDSYIIGCGGRGYKPCTDEIGELVLLPLNYGLSLFPMVFNNDSVEFRRIDLR